METNQFAVTSQSFALYEAFKKDVEKLGYKDKYNFISNLKGFVFLKNSVMRLDQTGFYVGSFHDWEENLFKLDFQYGEALQKAREIIEKEELNCRLGEGVNAVFKDDCNFTNEFRSGAENKFIPKQGDKVIGWDHPDHENLNDERVFICMIGAKFLLMSQDNYKNIVIGNGNYTECSLFAHCKPIEQEEKEYTKSDLLAFAAFSNFPHKIKDDYELELQSWLTDRK